MEIELIVLEPLQIIRRLYRSILRIHAQLGTGRQTSQVACIRNNVLTLLLCVA